MITYLIAILDMLATVNQGLVVYGQQVMQPAARYGVHMGSVAQQCNACYAVSAANNAIKGDPIVIEPNVAILASVGVTGNILSGLVSGNILNSLAAWFPVFWLTSVYHPRRTSDRRGGNEPAKRKNGCSLTFWAILFGFMIIPITTLSIELGRYFYPGAEIAKDAEAAALVAVAVISRGYSKKPGIYNQTTRPGRWPRPFCQHE